MSILNGFKYQKPSVVNSKNSFTTSAIGGSHWLETDLFESTNFVFEYIFIHLHDKSFKYIESDASTCTIMTHDFNYYNGYHKSFY